MEVLLILPNLLLLLLHLMLMLLLLLLHQRLHPLLLLLHLMLLLLLPYFGKLLLLMGDLQQRGEWREMFKIINERCRRYEHSQRHHIAQEYTALPAAAAATHQVQIEAAQGRKGAEGQDHGGRPCRRSRRLVKARL